MEIIRLDKTDSTNNYLKAHCGELSDGCVVTARLQTAGRGRCGHSWAADESMLPMSVLLKNPPEYENLTARVGLAVCEALERVIGDSAQIGIKWPNDVIINRHKVCGILCESVFFGDSINVIAGIGVNISQGADFFEREKLPNASSLLLLTGKTPDREALLRKIAENVIFRAKMPFAECRADYSAKVLNIGCEVRIISPNGERTAAAVRIADNGFLVCRDSGGEFEVSAGEVSVRGADGYI